LRQLMHDAPWSGRKALVRLLPQPGQYDPSDVREAVIEGVRLRLFPREYIQWVHYFGWPDPNFESLSCLAQDKSALLDIGANVGVYSLRTAARAPHCKITAVEAHPRTFSRLCGNAELNPGIHVELVHAAVASESGTLRLFDFEEGDSGLATAVARAGTTETRSLDVQALTLDELVRSRKLEPDLLKIDVEGYEPDVLSGGTETIARLKPCMVLEWTPEWSRGREHLSSRAIDLLEAHGYRAWKIPSLDAPAMQELPLSHLRGTKGAQRNLVVSCDRSVPERLERRFRTLAGR
jgi:FkbM family methyltransferase